MAKGKKAKSPGKGKKGKDGGKAKPASKSSSPGKAASAAPSQEQSSTQPVTTGSSQNITAGSTASLMSAQSGASASQTGLFKPLNRPMLPPLVLPADRSLSLTRRPSPIIVREWGDVWFFPVSVLAMALVVLGMITLTLHMKAEEMEGEPDNDTAFSNATAGTVAESTAFISLILPTTFSKPKGTMVTTREEPSTSLPTPEQELPMTGDDVESTTLVLATGTGDVPLASTNAEEDNKAATTKDPWRPLGGPGKPSGDDLTNSSLDLYKN